MREGWQRKSFADEGGKDWSEQPGAARELRPGNGCIRHTPPWNGPGSTMRKHDC